MKNKPCQNKLNRGALIRFVSLFALAPAVLGQGGGDQSFHAIQKLVQGNGNCSEKPEIFHEEYQGDKEMPDPVFFNTKVDKLSGKPAVKSIVHSVPLNKVMGWKPMSLESMARNTSEGNNDDHDSKLVAKEIIKSHEIPKKAAIEKPQSLIVAMEQTRTSAPSIVEPKKNAIVRQDEDVPLSSALFAPAVGAKSYVDKDILLNIRYVGDKLTTQPKTLLLKEVSSQVPFSFKDEASAQTENEDLAMFVRNNAIVSIEKTKSKIVALDTGSTELFVVYRGKMIIVPISVGNDWDASAILADEVDENNLQNALNNVKSKITQPKGVRFDQQSNHKSASAFGRGYALQSSPTSAQLTKIQEQKNGDQFQWKSYPLNGKTVVIQIVDERSSPEENALFPVSGILLNIVGTKYSAPTDIQGKVKFYDVPSHGRLLVRINDPAGNYLPGMIEVPLESNDENEVVIIKVLSQKTFDLYQNVYSIVQQSNKASLCGKVVSDLSTRERENFSGVQLTMNLASSGARYFNRFGPADSQMETDALGRFCFFNVQPGLAEITVHKRNDYLTSFVMPLGAGLHVEEDVRLEEIDNITINLAGLPSFNQQVYGSRNDANRFSPVDFAELFIIGANRRLNFLENGLVDNDGENMDMFRNRIYLLNQSSEFEPVIYAVEGSDRSHPRDLIVPLLQRGFIEDLILELGSAGNVSSADLDASLGSMIIYLPKGVNPKAELSIKLFNSDGVEVEGGWYFGEQDPEMAKAVFYNLEKGFYLGVAQDRDGVWYGVNTIPVDYWTTSFMILGGNISK